MIHDAEFDLTWADPPPRWVEHIGPLMDVWDNPIFQRRYVLWKLEPSLGPRKAFAVGLAFSLLLNVFLLMVTDKEDALGLGFLVTLVIPGFIAVAFAGVRLFVTCLIATPRELQTEFAGEMLGPILVTPLGDSKIFFAECLSGLMRGLGAIEEIIALLLGLLLPYLALMSPQLWPVVQELGIQAVWLAVLFCMALIGLALLLILTALSAGLYAVLLPFVATVPVTLFHVLTLWLGTGLLGSWMVALVCRLPFLDRIDPLLAVLAASSLSLAGLVVSCALTGHLGMLAFARARRPGYYEPMRATAAGLLMRERSYGGREHYRFGQQV